MFLLNMENYKNEMKSNIFSEGLRNLQFSGKDSPATYKYQPFHTAIMPPTSNFSAFFASKSFLLLRSLPTLSHNSPYQHDYRY